MYIFDSCVVIKYKELDMETLFYWIVALAGIYINWLLIKAILDYKG